MYSKCVQHVVGVVQQVVGFVQHVVGVVQHVGVFYAISTYFHSCILFLQFRSCLLVVGLFETQ